jgi:hypothetical protein
LAAASAVQYLQSSRLLPDHHPSPAPCTLVWSSTRQRTAAVAVKGVIAYHPLHVLLRDHERRQTALPQR